MQLIENLDLVSIDDLKEVKFKEKAFKKVVIKDEHKQIVKAMVEAYTQEQPGFNDIVNGKGRGLIVLLHGPPGTGKTLTVCTSMILPVPAKREANVFH